jgi:predicted secreted protein
MTIPGALAVYFIIWWTVLFAVLPFGVRSQAESGDVVAGSEPGAPVLPGLVRKAAITSVVAAVIFAFVWYLWTAFDI